MSLALTLSHGVVGKRQRGGRQLYPRRAVIRVVGIGCNRPAAFGGQIPVCIVCVEVVLIPLRQHGISIHLLRFHASHTVIEIFIFRVNARRPVAAHCINQYL